MELLYWLESIRNPVLDVFFSAITYLGSEIVFMILALAIYWCVSKSQGLYLLSVGCLGTTLNQFLKITCRIPRPWVRDPSLTVVGNAKEAATGYSFPSGHTQNITGTLGVVAATRERRWPKLVRVVLILLTAFSRMYLGVHTPADVLTSLVIGGVLVLALRPLMNWVGDNSCRLMGLLLSMLGISLLFLAYVYVWSFPADIDPVELAEARKNAWTRVGAVGGICVGCAVDLKWLHFPTRAVWWAQLLKVAVGIALVLLVKEGLKPVLAALFDGAMFSHAIRYFFCVLTATVLWPLSFRWFEKLGKQ